MLKIVRLAIHQSRLTIATLLFLVLAGLSAYNVIPKEAEPDVQVPVIYVSVSLQGISPEDSERLLLRPLETELKTVSNVTEMRSTAFEGGGFVLLEFDAGSNIKEKLTDVRAKVDDAKAELPSNADEPKISEVNLSLFPVFVVTLSGNVPERTLIQIARNTRDKIEDVSGVLEAKLTGAREEVANVLIDPKVLESYDIELNTLVNAAQASNRLVAAGVLEGQTGRYGVKLPALIEDVEDILDIPIVAGKNAVLTAGDLARIRFGFKDAQTITRFNGKPAIAIEVSKRIGSNLIDTVSDIKAVMDDIKKTYPDGIIVDYSQDKSLRIINRLEDLQNSVITAVLLVFMVILWALGPRSSILIGMAVPASFLIGILALSLMGLTVNIVVLFALILSVGMLVDDSIIVCEYADRRMSEGAKPFDAYTEAAHRMVGPVIGTTITRLAAFSPLLFWPGIVGQFMKYLPITLIATLAASTLYALVFAPTLGALIGKSENLAPPKLNQNGMYARTVRYAIKKPRRVLLAAFGLLIAVPIAYAIVGKGVEFFPNVEPEQGLVYVHARGNFSVAEKDAMIKPVEDLLLHTDGITNIYTRVGAVSGGGNDIAEDVIAVLQFEFSDYRTRAPAFDIMADLREKAVEFAGIHVEPRLPQAGPPTGKPIQIQVTALNTDNITQAAKQIAEIVETHPDVRDLEDGAPPPGIDWKLHVNKEEAAKFGVSVSEIGTLVKLVTNGVTLTDYRPEEVTEPVDIVLRFDEDERTLGRLDDLRLETLRGAVPISTFVTREAVQRTGTLNRIDGQRIMNVQANVREGASNEAVRQDISAQLSTLSLPPDVSWIFKGESEDQAAAAAFLKKAFSVAIFMIFAILLAQFNRFSYVALVIMSILLSTIGVFIGLIVMNQAFSIVMTGLGIIALAGVVVTNNIVLIDTYALHRKSGIDVETAIYRTCEERVRPVLLTAITAILGVLPIAFAINIDFVNRDILMGAPSAQWWVQLSTAIVYGLAFATVLTLVITPSAIILVERLKTKTWRWPIIKSTKQL